MKNFMRLLLNECAGQSMFTREDVEHAFNSFLNQQIIVGNIEKSDNIELFYIDNPNSKHHGKVVKSDCSGNMAGLTKVTFENGKTDNIHIKFLKQLKK